MQACLQRSLTEVRIWGIELETAFLLFAVSFPLALAFLVYSHYRRYGIFKGWPALLTTATFLYLCAIIAFTLFPLPAVDDQFCSLGEDIERWRLIPFASFGGAVAVYQHAGLAAMLVSTSFLELFFNVLLLMPLGILLAYRYKKSFAFTAAAGLGVSLLIEFTQGTAVYGIYGCPYRVAEVDDLITNTTGAVLGYLLGRALTPSLPHPSPQPFADPGPPGVKRRFASVALDFLVLTMVAATIEIAVALAGLEEGGMEIFAQRWFIDLELLLVVAMPLFILFLLLPLWRRDHASIGQVCTWLAIESATDRPLKRRSIFIKFSARWLLWLTLLIFIHPHLALAVAIAVETGSVFLRRDRRSLSSVVANTRTVTRRSLIN